MSNITRGDFLKSSATAVAGATAIGALVAAQAEAEDRAGTEPVVAYMKNPRRGEITVMRGEREVVVRDRALAAKIARAVD